MPRNRSLRVGWSRSPPFGAPFPWPIQKVQGAAHADYDTRRKGKASSDGAMAPPSRFLYDQNVAGTKV